MAWWKSGFGFLGRCQGVAGVKPLNLSQNAGTHLYGSKYVRLMLKESPSSPSFQYPCSYIKSLVIETTLHLRTCHQVGSLLYEGVLNLSLLPFMHCASSRFIIELSIPKMQYISGIYGEESWISWWNCKIAEDHWLHWFIFHALPCWIWKKKHPIPSAPAAKSLEGSEECKLAYHQKLLSKNDVSMLCIMSSKMGRFSNDITVYTYIYIYIYIW